MEYRELGTTGEKVSTIGMGTWKMGNYRSEEDRMEQLRSLRRGIELGMNHIDTAEVYGGGRSEQLVRDAIAGRRDSVFIATKVSPEHLHHDDVIKSCKGSLERLGVNHIDLYQVHWPNPAVPISETMSAMEQLKREGKIRFIGVSNFSVKQVSEAREALSNSEIVSNQVEYSVSNRSVESELLPYCARERIALTAYSPLAQGNIPDLHIPPTGQKHGMTPAQVMLNWVTRNEVVVAIPKAGRVSHVEENAASVEVRFTPHEYDLISKSAEG